jgi:hypothetical protein
MSREKLGPMGREAVADGAGANYLTWSSRIAEGEGEEESRCWRGAPGGRPAGAQGRRCKGKQAGDLWRHGWEKFLLPVENKGATEQGGTLLR